MRVIAAVARAGSIAGAATVVGTTPQAVSARLRGAERALGLHLFDRTTAGTVATATGHDVATWAAEVLEAADRFEERTEQLRAPRPGTVRVAASLTIAEHLAPAWMVETAETTADRVELAAMNSVEVCAAVRARDVDLGFVESTDVPGDLASTLVARDELVLVAAPGSTVGTAGGLTLAELAATPLVTREEGSGTRSSFEHLCHAHGVATVAEPVRSSPRPRACGPRSPPASAPPCSRRWLSGTTWRSDDCAGSASRTPDSSARSPPCGGATASSAQQRHGSWRPRDGPPATPDRGRLRACRRAPAPRGSCPRRAPRGRSRAASGGTRPGGARRSPSSTRSRPAPP